MAVSTPAYATQPLAEFVASAQTDSFQAREQTVTTAQRDLERGAALGRLLPTFSARGVFTRNQYEAAVVIPGSTDRLVITPLNQVDALLQLEVPIVDLASYYRYRQAQALADVAEVQQRLVGDELTRAVSRAYYFFIGASALVEAADRSAASALENLTYVETRQSLGVATELDKERARANVERSKQDQADAAFAVLSAARTLETLTGMTPTAASGNTEDDLHHEGELSEWLANVDTPQDELQQRVLAASQSGEDAATAVLFPTLSASAQQRFSNATGFAGQAATYTLQAVLSWRLDYGSYKISQAQAAAVRTQEIRAERTRREVEDSIFDAFHRVETGIAKSASARAQAVAASKAQRLALERFKAGTLTQLDVTQSQRDAFLAEAVRIQADADLAYARVLLRVVSGRPPSP